MRASTLRRDEIARASKECGPARPVMPSVGEQAFRREAILLQGFGILARRRTRGAGYAFCCWRCGRANAEMAQTRWRRTLCWMADYSPPTLLVAIGAFLRLSAFQQPSQGQLFEVHAPCQPTSGYGLRVGPPWNSRVCDGCTPAFRLGLLLPSRLAHSCVVLVRVSTARG